MTAAEIAARLGAAHRSGRFWRCLCPVHGSRTGRSATLALRDGDHGLIVKCFAGCDPRDILAELRRRGLIEGREESRIKSRPSRPIDRRDDGRRNIEFARRIWDAARDARGSPVVCYLARRGITLPLPPSLRWVPECPHPGRICLPAMVAAVLNADGELIGVHRTFLQPDGSGKANIEPQKASLGPISGGAVRLAPAAETLLIGEGLETSCAAMQATAQPTWAALSHVWVNVPASAGDRTGHHHPLRSRRQRRG